MKLISCCNANASSLISLFNAIILIFLLNITATTTLAFVGTSSVNNMAHQTRNNNAKNTHLERKSMISDKNNNLNLIRGEKHYNTENCPIIVAERLGVQPTKINAPAKTWKRAWKIHKRLIPILHSTDSCKPSDSSLNIACMWWKSLSGNDKSSPVYDSKLAYDLLPSGWRNIIRLRKFYPRLHHGNVELRTAYLDNQISEIKDSIIIKDDGTTTTTMIRLVCMGAGYDTRGVKMLERSIADQVYELDLPDVVEAKQRLFQRLLKRRPWLQKEILSMPTLIPCDFNIISDVEKKLRTILFEQEKNDNDDITWHTIFVFEGVMIYLDDGIPSSLLNITSNVLKEGNLDGSLCFADRLENISTPKDDGDSYSSGEAELMDNGWQIMDWCPKPGLAKHMGSAKLSTGTYIT
jgi:uncharacterized protein (UPF0333 family)